MFIIPRGFTGILLGKSVIIGKNCDFCYLTSFLIYDYAISIFAPNLFISCMKFGYETWTDSESVTVQFPI